MPAGKFCIVSEKSLDSSEYTISNKLFVISNNTSFELETELIMSVPELSP
jgi:hypothetical protein